jgi:pimeloyl-ACP methyl ester carboxylesterase
MQTPIYSQTNDKTYVLVHGAWYGGRWNWEKVTPLLESKGYRVVTIDLPGYGDDTRLPSTLTLDDYVTKVTGAVQSIKGKVSLVGHSMGGAIISQASEILGPEKVDNLIYLDAFLLRDGESILSQVAKMNAVSTLYDAAHEHSSADFMIFSDDQKTCLFNPVKVEEYFCHDCPADDLARVKANLRWQPVSVLATPIKVSNARYGSIPKFFIRCTASRDLDRRSILENVPCKKVYELQSSHSPFFSMPEKLALILEEVY